MLTFTTGPDTTASVKSQQHVGTCAGKAALSAASAVACTQGRSPGRPLPPKTPAVLADAVPPQLPGNGSPASALTLALQHGAGAHAAMQLRAPGPAAGAAGQEPGADEGWLQDDILLFTGPPAAPDPSLLVHSPGASLEPGHAPLAAGAAATLAARSPCSSSPTAWGTRPGGSAGSADRNGVGDGTLQTAVAGSDLMSSGLDSIPLADLLQVGNGLSCKARRSCHAGVPCTGSLLH